MSQRFGMSFLPSSSSSKASVKPYDFRRPDKFSKEQLRALETMFNTWARVSSLTLSSYLRTPVQSGGAELAQVLFDEYIQGLPERPVIALISLAPLPGTVLLQVDIDLAFVIVDRLLGGPGQPPPQVREPTEIEDRLLRELLGQLVGNLKEAWRILGDLSPALEDLIYSAQPVVQVALATDACLKGRVEFNLLGRPWAVTFCVPFPVIEPVARQLNIRMLLDVRRREPDRDESLVRRRLEQAQVDLNLILGRASLSLRDLVGLQPGDVIRLDQPIDRPLELAVAGRTKFLVRPGRVGRRLAGQVVKVLSEEELKNGAGDAGGQAG
jgi:flagellar motor switch protein FliM